VAEPRLRIRLTAAAESIVRSGHPWIFANSVREQNRAGTTGELAVIYDRNDRFLAIGLYDPDSVLRIRVLHSGKPVTIDDAWWKTRLDASISRREGILDEQTDDCRLINGESDGWPGLVLDCYAGTLVLKLYTFAWIAHLDSIVSLIKGAKIGGETTSPPAHLVLRLSRNVQPSFAAKGLKDGQVLFGTSLQNPVIFRETGILFEADVLAGQKTGFFLDQRENRRAVEALARGADVLNAFSFSGGFSLYAARGGAKSVTDLDISSHALASAQRNFRLNQNDSSIVTCRHETIQGNAFDWLAENSGRKFDLIVLDPPSLAKREKERAEAIRAYEKLAAHALTHLRSGGKLVAASCSAHVSADEFFDAVRRAAVANRRKFRLLNSTRHAPDHPATFPEAEYLKCMFLELD
jgi:23S rRNA (cytosine1962-C5)-methyltransferase